MAFAPPPRSPHVGAELNIRDFQRWLAQLNDYFIRLIAELDAASADLVTTAADIAAIEADITALEAVDATKVTGPASATDNAVTRYDATTGKLVQNSGVVIDDSNNVTGVVALTMSGAQTGGTTCDFTTSYSVNGTKVLGAQGAAVADASGGATIDTQARTALNALLARLRTHGVIAT